MLASSNHLKLETYNQNATTVVINLIGKYDLSEIHNFESIYSEQLKNKPAVIALNLASLNYIDSSGIGSFVRCMNLANKDKLEFLCFGLNENIRSIFMLAKLDQFIKIIPNSEFESRYPRG